MFEPKPNRIHLYEMSQKKQNDTTLKIYRQQQETSSLRQMLFTKLNKTFPSAFVCQTWRLVGRRMLRITSIFEKCLCGNSLKDMTFFRPSTPHHMHSLRIVCPSAALYLNLLFVKGLAFSQGVSNTTIPIRWCELFRARECFQAA